MSATVSTLLQDINIKDGNFVDRLDNRTLYQANDYKLQLTFLDGNDRADGTDLAFSFVVQSTSGEVFDIAGAWTTATSGEGTISVPAASLNFTGTDYMGLIRFNGSVVAEFPLVVKAYGTPAPEAGTMIDWSIYTGYSNTATHGPVRPGTGITNVVNADGSNTHSVTYGSTASTAAEGNDARLSDARTPTAHASTHATGGSDPVTAADVDVAGTAIAAALALKADDNAVVKLAPTPSTVQTLNGGSGFTQLNITGESGYLAVGRTTSGGEAVHVVRDETAVGSWQVGILTTAKESEHSAYEIYRNETGNLFVGFWVSRVDKLCRAVYGLVAPIIKSAATTGLVVQNSDGAEKLKVGAATGADVQVTGTQSVSGNLTAGVYTAAYAANQTLTATECFGYIIYVTAACTITLPAIASGMSVTIITIGDIAVSVDPNASDKIVLDGTALDDGDKITNASTAGDVAVLTYYSADGWYASTNDWTDGGA
jgi:hypothetical protein